MKGIPNWTEWTLVVVSVRPGEVNGEMCTPRGCLPGSYLLLRSFADQSLS